MKPVNPGGGASSLNSASTNQQAFTPPPKKRWHIVVPVAVLLLLIAMAILPARDLLTPTVAVQVHPVLPAKDTGQQPAMQLATANTKPRATRTVQAPGWLEPDPYLIACTALADGVVSEIHALEGESVEKGQVVAKLVDDDAKLAVARAEADLQTTKASLAAAQAVYDAAKTEWDEPYQREHDVQEAAAELAQAEAQVKQFPSQLDSLEAQYVQAEKEAKRTKEVRERGAATEFELLIQEARARQRKAELQTTKLSEGILVAKLARAKAHKKYVDRAFELRIEERRKLNEAAARVTQAKASVVEAQVRLDEAKLRLSRMTIRAPITGRVLRRIKSPGDKVVINMDGMHSAHLLHLYNPEQIQVRVDVPLADAAQIYVGQQCEVIVEVLPDQSFAGKVTRITHKADLQKNTLQVKVAVIDPDPVLRPEMLTRVRFLADGSASHDMPTGDKAATSARVHKDTVESQSDGSLRAWAIRNRRGKTGEVQPVTLKKVAADGDWLTVTGNVQPGELLIRLPQSLSPKTVVRIEPQQPGGAI